ncbi:SMI1/KNR4 family protein [Streptococcus mutans]|uniref:SMI1/KNR4 family protein n=1 Tax=Streptococcus mutans TaxID=1309 RepID=UPI0003049F3F|nr:SMI1/KNR4 family protein [Streptococcus mutans]
MILDILRNNGYKLEEDFSKEVAKAETILGITFAKDYREALAKFGNFEVNNHEFTGVQFENYLNIVVATVDNREYCHEDTTKMYVIEELGVDGIAIWQNSKGEIFQTIPRKEVKPEKIYDTFLEYLENEVLDSK